MILWLLACATPAPAPASAAPDPCKIYLAPAPGPLDAARAAAGDDPMKVATVRIKEARLTGDPGFYTLAETALRCAQARKPDDKEAARLLAHLGIQFHRFAEVEGQARKLTADNANWLDWALLGDAEMEQGKLDAAGDAYQKAADLRPGIEMYDRIAWLRWLWGDVDGAIEMQKLAVESGTAQDPEPWAWVLTRLGWLHALRGEPAPELDAALALLPDYRPARLARGKVELYEGDPRAADDLRAAGRTVEAVWSLSEIDRSETVEAVHTQDPRGYAMWLTPKDPKAALVILQDEYQNRQDATTRMARAYAAWRAKDPTIDAPAEARAALATGSVEPRVLLYGGRILGDDALIARAVAMGPGLLPSERK